MIIEHEELDKKVGYHYVVEMSSSETFIVQWTGVYVVGVSRHVLLIEIGMFDTTTITPPSHHRITSRSLKLAWTYLSS